jgi:hypothetical protein
MLNLKYDYISCVTKSEEISWKLDDLFPKTTKLRFDKAHMPDGLVAVGKLSSLSAAEKMRLNQIRGNSYMNIFGFVEEYIIAQTVQHAEAEMFGDHDAIRALLRFGEEEVKHQTLFKRYIQTFNRDFGTPCGVLDNAAEVARIVLSKSPLAAMLMTTHIELMTQHHYVSAVRDTQDLDEKCAAILKHHWLEESQHARIDILELDKLAEQAGPDVIRSAYDDYLAIVSAFATMLDRQVDMDMESLEASINRKLNDAERREIVPVQRASYRHTLLQNGMQHRTFDEIAHDLSPSAHDMLRQRAASIIA